MRSPRPPCRGAPRVSARAITRARSPHVARPHQERAGRTRRPDAPTAEKSLKIAIREASTGQADRLIRLAKEDASEIVFAVVREQRPGDGSLDYHQEARIQLDRQREVFSSDRPGHDLVAAVR